MPLPRPGTDEWNEEIAFYKTSTLEDRERRAKELGVLRISYERRMYAQGIKPPKRSIQPISPSAPKVVSIPDLKIKPYKIGKEQRDEEDIVIVLSDHHVGRETSTYNPIIYKNRMDYLLDSAMTIIELHRPIKKIYVFMLGDIVQGESIYKGSNIEECKIGAYGQIHELAIPTLSSFMVSLSQGAESLEWYGIRGNHGRYDKTAVPRTNWDNFLYAELNTYLKEQNNIQGNVSTDFFQLVNIRGFLFFLLHGDQVRATQGIPLFALRRKLQEYYAYVGGFHHAYCGHWHSKANDAINSIADITICPPIVTGDDWALEVIGRASKPVQLAFGVHKRYGRTWEYNLYTDRNFVPEPAPRS